MQKSEHTKLIVYTDGGSRNNPGHAGIGFVISDEKGTVLTKEGRYIGIATNNEAEYQAMLSAVQHIRNFHPNCANIHLHTDSELMAKQLTKVYKIREERLKGLAQAIWQLLSEIKDWKITHVLRDKNKVADKLVNDALDSTGH